MPCTNSMLRLGRSTPEALQFIRDEKSILRSAYYVYQSIAVGMYGVFLLTVSAEPRIV